MRVSRQKASEVNDESGFGTGRSAEGQLKRPRLRRRLVLEPLEDRRMLASVPAAYLISVIGPQNGVSSSIPLAINNNSQVVGVTDTPTITGQAEQAFLYSGGAMQNLGSLPSGNTSLADAISDSGEIAADSFSLNGASTGFVVNGGALQSIGALTQSAGATSQANGVNSSGQVVGYSNLGSNLSDVHAILYSNGVMQDLGTLPGGLDSQALGINASGQVTGFSDVPSSVTPPNFHAFLYGNGVMNDLGTLPGGTESLGQAINSSGAVAGIANLPGGLFHPMLDSGGVMQDLGVLPGAVSGFAAGINDSGQVVGACKLVTGELHAFLYTGKTLVDLNSLIAPSSGWVLSTAQGINNSGQIVGQGTFNGRPAGYLLTPVIDGAAIATQPPATVSATSQPFSMVVAADSAPGIVDTAYSGTITISIASGPAGAALGGSFTAPAVNGLASFANLTLNLPGTYTLQATGPWLAPVTTQAFSLSVPSSPTNIVPGAQTTLRSTVNPSGLLLFSVASGNLVAVTDPAVGSGVAQVALSVKYGTLTLGSAAGVTIVSGANSSKALTIQGAPVALTTALRGLAYVPAAAFSGSDTLSMVSSDLGHTTLGSAQSTSSQIAITVGSTTAAVGYTVTDLGTLGGSSSYANAINASGQVAGWARAVDGRWHAMFYNGGVMQDLGTLNAGPSALYESIFSYGTAINDNGQEVGWNQQTIAGNQAFMATGGVMQILNLGAATQLLTSQAFGINGNGDVVGVTNTTNGAGPDAFLSHAGTVQNLGVLPGGIESEAIGVNASDQVVGASFGSSGMLAFLYSNGAMQSLGTLPGGTQSQANAINASGQIVGYSSTSNGSVHAFLDTNGVMQDLGVLPGDLASEANGINALGQVVGYATTPSGGDQAFVIRAGVMQNLNALIAPASGWILDFANGINANGQIVGEGTVGGLVHAFLLTPLSAAAAQLHAPIVTNATTTQNVQTTSGLVITPNALDAAVVTNFEITGIAGGTLYLNDGVTQVVNGMFITAAQAAAGLKFTPALNSTAAGSFVVQESLNANATGLGPISATATITVAATATKSLSKAASTTVKSPVTAASAADIVFSQFGA